MNEIKIVPSTPFLGVTADGRVMNMLSHKWLKACDNGHGYKQVFVSVQNKRYMRYVHRLVAECFVPNPDNALEINHIDGDKANNSAGNLEWCTHSHNLRHAYRTGLRVPSERQKQVAREYAKKHMYIMRSGWKRWAKTPAAKEHWMKNLALADRWGKGGNKNETVRDQQ